MTQSLPQVAHEHHDLLLHHVNALPAMADGLLTATAADARRSLADTAAFLTGTLLPHIDAAERTIYPELERMFQNRHSMAPMRREHEEIRRLVGVFGTAVAQVGSGPLTLGRCLAIRRVVFQLFALLKIHLAEEEAYLRIVERAVETDVADVLAAAMEHPVGVTAG
jgi:hemerythrin-like domain-containing protein